MLTDAEKRDIESEIRHYPFRQAGCIDALKVVQRSRGWISDEVLVDIAQFLQVSPDELDGVATFYNLIFRKPVGRHVILLCDSASCWILGADEIRRQFEALGLTFGATGKDGRFTLLPVPCLGACDHAPAMMINDDLYRRVSPSRLEAALRGYP
jgi:NADH-quinone oxidoreductase subunit E